MTRLDSSLGSAAGMRAALLQAVHHARHRQRVRRQLIDQPLMRNVLADLSLESEAATTLVLRVAGAIDRRCAVTPQSATSAPATAVGQVLGVQAAARRSSPRRWNAWAATATSRRPPSCPGSTGRRRSTASGRGPATSTPSTCCAPWTANRQPGRVPRRDRAARAPTPPRRGVEAVRIRPSSPTAPTELRARRIVERMALVLQGSLLVRHAPPALADAFTASRLAGDHGLTFGTLPRRRTSRACSPVPALA